MTKNIKTEKPDKKPTVLNTNLNTKQRFKINSHKEALIISGVYGLFGILWITLSDYLLYMIAKDISRYKQIQTYKGWVYVLITIGLIYLLVRKRSLLVQKTVREMRTTYEELQATYEELVATEEELRDQKSINYHIFNDAHVIIGTWDRDGRLTSLNPFGQTLFEYTEEEVLNKRWLDLLIPDENKALMVNDFNRINQGKQLPNHESQFITKSKRKVDIIWNNSLINYQNRAPEVLSIGTDISDRKKLEEELKNVAYYDALTGLPNRISMEKDVVKRMKANTEFAFLHIGMDNFKQINEALGRSVGDRFLQYIAGKLSEVIKRPDQIARISGDEFAVLLPDTGGRNEIVNVVEALNGHIGTSWEMNHHAFFISFSVGIALYPGDGTDHNALFRNADIAMHRAKKEGKGRCIFYSEGILKDNIDNLKLASRLQYAIKNNELILFYQPQYNLASGKITGVEALVRWLQPDNSFIPPARFIPLAEETGQIFEIERWIISTALQQKKTFEKMGRRDLKLSINLSGKALASETSFNAMEELFTSYDIDYSNITIEITETAIISDLTYAVERLKKLKQLGVKIALDDFGTGYSSLTHLKELPIDIVKLDRSFIKNLKEDNKNAIIIKALLYLTLDLNYEVIAEGIETEEQLKFLKKYRCRTGQGYLMSKPVDIAALYDVLSAN